MKSICIIVSLFLFNNLFFKTAESSPLPIPDQKQYKAFLLEPWENNKPVLIAFKDPFCPYCLKDLKKRKQLNKYNVFLFWSAILGERSVSRVRDIFNCESPSNETVLKSIIERVSPNCTGSYKEKLFELNKKMVASYKPNAVPQYWLGGRQVSLRRLKLNKNIIDANSVASSSAIKINWARYKYNAINEPLGDRFSVAIVLPEGRTLSKKNIHRLSIDKRYNWYVFGGKNNQNELWCKRNVIQCRQLPVRKKNYKNNSAEIKLLIGLDKTGEVKVVFEGKLVVEKEKKHLFSREMQQMLEFKFE